MRKKQWYRWVTLALAVCLMVFPGCKNKSQGERYEITSPELLRKYTDLAQPGDTLVLMEDIDLEGAVWQPLSNLKGTLDGNGKTISNFTLTESKDGNIGFFACLDGTVENLHLENVELMAGQAQYAGMIVGTNRGLIQNCTVTGSITDSRAESCVGILAGRNDGGKVISGEDLLTATAGSSNPQDKAEGLTGQVAVYFPEGRAQTVGIVGKTDPENVDLSMCWQDTTGSFDRLSEAQQQRRQAVVDMMHRMGTVRWTPSEEIRYTANDNRKSTHSNVYLPGRTYVGIPYNGCEGSYERFMTQMQAQTDDQGRYVTVTGLEDGIKTKSGEVSGFILNMGNDCVGAVIWALAAGVPYSVEDLGVELVSPPYMVPNAYNTENFGVLPAGGYQVLVSDTTKYDDGIDARDTQDIIALNGGAVAMAEYYAKAYRGDYLLCMTYSYKEETGTWKRTTNHGRMLAYEPMIIRGWNGDIDLERSYVITHEQGDGLYDNRLETGEYETYQGYNLKQTSWRTDHKYTLSLLMTQQGYNSAYLPGSGYGYVPVTVAAYSHEGPLADFSCREREPGVYESNYLLTCATMTIRDGQDNIAYEKTAYLPYRVFPDFKVLKPAELFPDAGDSLTSGKTYYATLEATATGGNTCTVLDREAFTY